MYVPTQFANKVKGMGSGLPLSYTKNLLAKAVWCLMAYCNKLGCKVLSKLNVEKQRANRPLEWFSSIECIVTGNLSSWKHFLSLRLHPDAQPEMQVLAKCIKEAIDKSIPNILRYGEVHLPYDIGPTNTITECSYNNGIPHVKITTIDNNIEDRKNIAVGRCAGVSYINEMQVSKALELGKKLKDNKHLSPYEHIATCMSYEQRYFNLQGWKSYRYEIENEK